jgi:hypothetical protein
VLDALPLPGVEDLIHGTTGRASVPSLASATGSKLNQPAEVVAEVHHPDLEPRPRDADGAHDLAVHRALLVAEYVLDTGAHLRARRVRRLLAL